MVNSDKIEASKRIVEETKRLYSGLLPSKPTLSDKQLLRPPFKFIQDLVKILMQETRILRDVFGPADFEQQQQQPNQTSKTNSRSNLRNLPFDRRTKIEFVQKLIDFVANNNQPVVSCVASKVVAGLEPNKTNELLQSLAKIAQQKLNGKSSGRRLSGVSTLNSGASNCTNISSSTTTNEERPRTFTRSGDKDLKRVDDFQSNTKSGERRRLSKELFSSSSSFVKKEAQHTKNIEQKQWLEDNDDDDDDKQQEKKQQRIVTNGGENGDTLIGVRRQSLGFVSGENNVVGQGIRQVKMTTTTTKNDLNTKQTKVNLNSSSAVKIVNSIQVASESDIHSKGIQRLRSNLNGLQPTLSELSQIENLLKDTLEFAIKQISEKIEQQVKVK